MSIIWIFRLLCFSLIKEIILATTDEDFKRTLTSQFSDQSFLVRSNVDDVQVSNDRTRSFGKYLGSTGTRYVGTQLINKSAISSQSGDVNIKVQQDVDSKNNLNINKGLNRPKHSKYSIQNDLKETVDGKIDLDSKNTGEEHRCECDCCQEEGKSVTIVTALFDIGRKRWSSFTRTYQDYLNFAQNVLRLDVNLVFYVEERGRYFVENHRRGKEQKTEVVVMEWKNLTFYRYITAIETVMGSKEFKSNNRLLNHPEGFSPLYNLLMSSKFSIMYETTIRNPFHSDYFFWMDAGYGHGKRSIFPPEGCPWAPCNILNDTISYINLHPADEYRPFLDQLYKMSVGPALNGGFFGGSKKAIQEYYKLYKDVLEDWLKNGKIDDDQTMALACYFKKPNLFNLVPGSWNDVFKLFK